MISKIHKNSKKDKGLKANFAGFASVSGLSENEQRQVLANFTQVNIGSEDNSSNLHITNNADYIKTHENSTNHYIYKCSQ